LEERAWVSACSSPPGFGRRPSYFHLLAQMKVTKAKCLNTIWLVDVAANWCGCWATEETVAFPLGPFAAARLHRRRCVAKLGVGSAIKGEELECSVEARTLRYSSNPNRWAQLDRSARWVAREQRPVKPPSGERVREETVRSPRWSNNRASFEPRQRAKSYLALCFGYFHLCQQMKVTRLPAETRRAVASSKEPRTSTAASSKTRSVLLVNLCIRISRLELVARRNHREPRDHAVHVEPVRRARARLGAGLGQLVRAGERERHVARAR
jgi:hypothetical protein